MHGGTGGPVSSSQHAAVTHAGGEVIIVLWNVHGCTLRIAVTLDKRAVPCGCLWNSSFTGGAAATEVSEALQLQGL